LLLAINLVNYVDRQVLAAVVPLIKKDLFPAGAATESFWLKIEPSVDFWIGLLPTAFLISYMIASPLFGWLGDRMSRWAIVGGGVIAWSVASGASGLATTFGLLFAARLFVGIGEAAYGPVAPTLISDQFPVSRRGTMLSYLYIAIPVGSALGYMFGGLVAKSLTWHWAFYLSVPPGILLGVLAFFMPEPPRGALDGAETSRAARLSDYTTLLRTRSYVLATAGMTALTFAIGGIAFWIPTYVNEFRGVENLDTVNIVFGGITVVSGLTATLLGGWVADRLRGRWPGSYFLVSGISTLLAVPFFLAVLYVPFPTAWAFIFLSEFCLFFNTGPANTILANVTHPAVRSTAFAFNILVIHLFGDAISPPLIGKISSLWGGNMNAGFAAVSLMIAVAGVCWLFGAPHLARDTEMAPRRLEPID
jgi:MFS family permease